MAVATCKNISFNSHEYVIYRNNELKTLYSPTYFNLSDCEKDSNSSLRLCFPFNEDFLRCPKWKFSPNELFYNISIRTLTYNLSHQSYNLGDYVTNNDNFTYLCIPQNCLPPPFNMDALFVFFWSLSILGLLLSIFFYFPQTINRNHLKPPLFHMIALLLTYVFLILQQTSHSSDNTIWRNFLSFGNIYAALAAYAWLNIVGYDAWKQFHPERIMIQSSVSTRHLIFRLLYGWGLPLLLTCIATIPEWLAFSGKRSKVDRAGVQADLLNYIVVIGGLSVLIVLNFVFFGVILFNLRQLRKELDSQNTNVSLSLHNIRVPVRLFSMMGLVFVCVIIAFVLGPSKEIYFSFFDAVISLQGFFLFLIYGFSPLIQKLLIHKSSVQGNTFQSRLSRKTSTKV